MECLFCFARGGLFSAFRAVFYGLGEQNDQVRDTRRRADWQSACRRQSAASKAAKVVYVADAMAKAASDLAATVGAKTASVEEIIAAKDVDAILIATPTGTHADLIEAGVECRQGHSLREAGVTVGRADPELPQGGRKEQVEPDDRLQPPLRSRISRALEKRIRNGDIGTVELATIISRDPAPPPV
ncbi:MAG: Gfo/Idh/MocA family oxidoreductase [Saprospiraceae bacterium]